MNEQEYIEARLEEQIAWHDRKSQWNQKFFKRFQLVSILASAMVPFVSGLGSAALYEKIAVGALGVIAAVAVGVLGLYRFQELWADYRLTAEALRAEKFRYQTKVVPFDGPESFLILVDRVETLLSHQNLQWQKRQESGKKEKGE